MTDIATILGIDAAWTAEGASGVALVQRRGNCWSTLAVAPSYQSFFDLAEGTPWSWGDRHKGTMPDIARLLEASRRVAKAEVDLIVADIPLARTAITGRRPADDAVSWAFGKYGCGTHSPSSQRPGVISETIRDDAKKAEYELITNAPPQPRKGLLETYPHPAILRLTGAKFRVPYKWKKSKKYWPNAILSQRRDNIVANLIQIYDGLKTNMFQVNVLPCPMLTSRQIVDYENVLDALVCCWVGALIIDKRAKPFGDQDAAIWLPE